jgi:hypothetical protein
MVKEVGLGIPGIKSRPGLRTEFSTGTPELLIPAAHNQWLYIRLVNDVFSMTCKTKFPEFSLYTCMPKPVDAPPRTSYPESDPLSDHELAPCGWRTTRAGTTRDRAGHPPLTRESYRGCARAYPRESAPPIRALVPRAPDSAAGVPR